MDPLTFVLVHGNFHDGSAWTGVAERLRQLGHVAHAPTVAGHGPHADRGIGITDRSQSIADYIVTNDLSDVVLVAHSGGGTWMCKAAEQVSERLRRLVFCNAYVLHDGESQLDTIAPAGREMLAQLAAATTDDTMVLPFDMWREVLINDADLALARTTYAQLSPEPHRLFAERRLGVYRYLSMPGSHEVMLTNPAGLADKLIDAGRD